MSMNVTYKVYNKKKALFSQNNSACFSRFFYSERKSGRIKVLLKHSPLTKDYIDFWIDLLKKIEPHFKVVKEKSYTWAVLKITNHSRARLFLTLLRYLWEDTNHYDTIVPLTKKLLEKFPEMDPFAAITAVVPLSKAVCAGHHHVRNYASWLPKTWHYRNLKYNSADGLVHIKDNATFFEGKVVREALKKKMADEMDLTPIIEKYQLEKNYNKLKYSYGSFNSR